MSDPKNHVDENDDRDGEDDDAEIGNDELNVGSYDDKEIAMEDRKEDPKPVPPPAPQARPARRGGGFMAGMRQPAPPPAVPPKPEDKPTAKPEDKNEQKSAELTLKIQQAEFDAFVEGELTFRSDVLTSLGGFNGIAIGITRLANAAKYDGKKPSQAYMLAVRKLLRDASQDKRFSREQVEQMRLVAWYVASKLFVTLGVTPETARAKAREEVDGELAKKSAEAADQDRPAIVGPPPMPRTGTGSTPKQEPKPVEPAKVEVKADVKVEPKPGPKTDDKKFCEKCGFKNETQAAFCAGCGNRLAPPMPKVETRQTAEPKPAEKPAKPSAALAPTVEAPTPAPSSKPVPPPSQKTPTPREMVREKVAAEAARGGYSPPEATGGSQASPAQPAVQPSPAEVEAKRLAEEAAKKLADAEAEAKAAAKKLADAEIKAANKDAARAEEAAREAARRQAEAEEAAKQAAAKQAAAEAEAKAAAKKIADAEAAKKIADAEAAAKAAAKKQADAEEEAKKAAKKVADAEAAKKQAEAALQLQHDRATAGNRTVRILGIAAAILYVLGLIAFLAIGGRKPATASAPEKPAAEQTVAAPAAAPHLVCEKATAQLTALHFSQPDPAHFPDPGPRQSGKPYVECGGQKVFHDTVRNTFDIRKCDVCYLK